ncbi:MAG: Flp pilus assembly complex ATPase component TadA [Planctomycetes bacterium]|nr:Flp pilus assembly complex ATPase component TadA [Planctomycetota bacterium]
MPSYYLKPIRGSAAMIRLGKDPVTIGRHPDNTIPLTDDLSSRFHCAVEPDGLGGFSVRDLGSRNGTKVNDQRIKETRLKPGDVLRVGGHEFVLAEDTESDRAGLVESHEDNAAPEDEEADKGWAQQLIEVIEELPPKDMPVESLTIIEAGGRPSAALAGSSDGPAAVRLLLQTASKSRATDVHIEPKSEQYHVRLRVDGQMVAVATLPGRVGELVYGLVKTACQMRTAARDAMQEGHFSAKFTDRRVEYRISFTPSVYGQKLVMRVLDDRTSPKSITELGMAGYMADRVRRVCGQDHGLLLVAGPTGSGKTTTLYTSLREIDRESRNVVTIEDPVEYQISNVTQIPIDESKGNNFGTLLRSVLRQDPDVILVGEIRDEETARTGMQAAMTGHLVFSTVHAKDTIAAVFRLLDLKVEPYLVANALDLVLGQRLVRVLCDSCKRPVPVLPGQATRLGRFLGGKTQMYVATGCPKCLKTGFRGRRALYELLDFNDELRDVVMHDPTIAAMKKVIEQGLFTTLAQFGWKLVAEGITTLEEVDKVAGQG